MSFETLSKIIEIILARVTLTFLKRLKAQSTGIRVSNFICVPKADQSLQNFEKLMRIVTVVLLLKLNIDVTMISHVMWLAMKFFHLPLHSLHDNLYEPHTHTKAIFHLD